MKKKIIYLALLILSDCVGAVQLSAGPSKIIFDDTIQGQTIDETITIATSGGEALFITIYPEGSIKDWLSFTPIDFDLMGEGRFTLPPKSTVHIKVRLKLPDDVEKGVYTGRIRINVKPLMSVEEGMGVSIETGTKLDVIVNVTNQPHPKIRVVDVSISDIKEEQPIELEFTAVNEGNVDVEPKLMVKVLDLNGTVIRHHKYNLDMPREKGDQKFVLDMSPEEIEPGSYLLNLTASVGNESVWRGSSSFNIVRKVKFEVLSMASTTTLPVELPLPKKVTKPKPNYTWHYITAVLIVIVLGVWKWQRDRTVGGKIRKGWGRFIGKEEK